MATDVELPQLGESVTEGTVTAWLVSVGDTVEADQPLFELSSDKIDTEVPSPAAGTVIEILVEVDETVEVGTVVARIGDSEEASGKDSDSDSGAGDTAEEAVEAAATENPETGQEELHDADEGSDGEDGADEGSGDNGGGESVDIIIPELGESVTEGTITAWLIRVGDEVTEDQPIFELSSDKIDTEVPSPAAGTVIEILVEVDETVDVGTVVARLGGSGGGGGSAASAAASGSGTSADKSSDGDAGDGERVSDDVAESPHTGDAPTTPAGPDALASPLVRKLAADNGIDLAELEGSGQGGRITRDDVEAAISGSGTSTKKDAEEEATAPSTPPAKAASAAKPEARVPEPPREAGERERVEDLSRIRQRIADKMIESQANAAQLTTVQEADVTALMNARTRHKDTFKSREGVSLSPFAIVARAALMAVRNHPMINAAADWDSGKLYLRDYVNLGIAVDTPKGLLVPNVKGADGLTVGGLARGIFEAAQKARGEGGKKLDFSDIEGGTLTLTNTGSVGVLIDTPILNYPEVAILGVGAIVKRPAVVTAEDGTEAIAIRQMLYLSLTYDHRLIDGADAARFVTEVKHVLEGTDWDQEIG